MKYLKIRARFFGFYRELVGISQADLEVEEKTSLPDLRQKLVEVFPPLKVFADNLLLAVNGEYGSAELDLKDGDEIAVLPPLGGGSDIEVTTDPISAEAVADKVKRDSYGALVTFAGRVRDNSEGQRVLYMEYEAFQEMAQKKLTQIADEVRARWQPLDIAISHRVGRLEVGEVALAIAVASPHRKEAFAACQYAVDRIKEIVPIWKKEIREDGGVWMTQ